MKTSKKIRIFALLTAILTVICTVSVFAAEKLDQNMHGGDLTFAERFEYAMQGTITGMVMVFAVLALLWGIISLSKVFLYDLPNRKKEEKSKEQKLSAAVTNALEDDESISAAYDPSVVAPAHDDGEIAAVITAAIAAMLESEEYKNEFVGGFRVVSFKRSSARAWNRK